MPDYVYALHDFVPEHDDEVAFRAGERIEVIERDEVYQDGWWTGRNLEGKSGLFPVAYTAPAPPTPAPPSIQAPPLISTATVNPISLQSLPEEEDSSVPIPQSSSPPDSLVKARDSQDGAMMQATLTDVQQAIEQLGRNKSQGEDGRSFSFASTRTGADTDTEHDTEMEAGDEDGEWARSTRTKLAEQSRAMVESASRREKEAAEEAERRLRAIPIAVDVSDESEGEDDDGYLRHHDPEPTISVSSEFIREHPYIPEEDENEQTLNRDGSITSDQDEIKVATARRADFPIIDPTSVATAGNDDTITVPDFDHSVPEGTALLHDTQPSVINDPIQPNVTDSKTISISASPPFSIPALPEPVVTDYAYVPPPFPAADVTTESSSSPPHSQSQYTPKKIAGPILPSSPSSPSSNGVGRGAPGSPPFKPENGLLEIPKKPQSHPTEWTVDEVVNWLRMKGFDQDVCDKFIEQEITGDVLLELDANVLKSEIGILAFGKRVRIANAITELRRPPSINYSDHLSANQPQTPITPAHTQTTTATSSYGHSYGNSMSVQSSISAATSAGLIPSPGSRSITAPDVNRLDDQISSAGASASEVGIEERRKSEAERLGLGLMSGSGMAKPSKIRPKELTLSPSDGQLSTKIIAQVDLPEETDEERVALSETEASVTKHRRHLFSRRRSTASDHSHRRESTTSRGSIKEPQTSPLSATPGAARSPSIGDLSETGRKDELMRHRRNKGSTEVGKSSDRLSLFGGVVSMGGKTRKPPPKLGPDDTSEKVSTLSRLYGSTSKRNLSSGRPTTADSQKTKDKSPELSKVFDKSPSTYRDPSLLRKRTSSSSQPSEVPARSKDRKASTDIGGENVVGNLKPGENVLDQIGEPDHEGWMRKRGERYNTWKMRFFILKGPHLYYLRSNSKAETRIKGYINVSGYKVVADENVNPGRYGFRIIHDADKTHYFSSEEQTTVREWMKAIMKATIGRDYSKPVMSSCNIPTIPLTVAQTMNPAPRPPSPSQRAATQKSYRRENPNQLSSRDAKILMGLPGESSDIKETDDKRRLPSFLEPISPDVSSVSPHSGAPSRPSREVRRPSVSQAEDNIDVDPNLIDWANSHLPANLRMHDTSGLLCGGLALLRLAESIKGRPASPPVPDSAFPAGPNDDKLDGLFALFDFLLANDVKMGLVSINDIRQGRKDKILQLLKALRTWEDKRRVIAESIGQSSVQAGAFIAPVVTRG